MSTASSASSDRALGRHNSNADRNGPRLPRSDFRTPIAERLPRTPGTPGRSARARAWSGVMLPVASRAGPLPSWPVEGGASVGATACAERECTRRAWCRSAVGIFNASFVNFPSSNPSGNGGTIDGPRHLGRKQPAREATDRGRSPLPRGSAFLAAEEFVAGVAAHVRGPLRGCRYVSDSTTVRISVCTRPLEPHEFRGEPVEQFRVSLARRAVESKFSGESKRGPYPNRCCQTWFAATRGRQRVREVEQPPRESRPVGRFATRLSASGRTPARPGFTTGPA